MIKTPYACLWYDGQAKAAAEFYCTIFENSKITTDTPMVVNFNLNGIKIMGLNGGPMFKLSEAFSLVVECETQDEIDYYWNKLSEGGEEGMCGWLKDKFGMSWQIIPTALGQLMSDPARGQRVMGELLKMKKLDLNLLLSA